MSTVTVPPAQLIARLAAGDEAAFTALYEYYEPRLRLYLLPFCESREETQEIIQDLFVRIWFKRDLLPAIDNIEAYLLKTARNSFINQHRRRARFLEVVSDKPATDNANATEDDVLLREYTQLAREAIDQLSPQKRTIFILRQEQDLSLDQIARQLKITKFAVKKQLYEATAQVRDYLRTHGGLPALILTWLTTHWLR